MNTTITHLIHMPRSAALAGLIVLAGVISFGTATPTHALSLDLGNTVTSLTNNIPIVNQVTPLLVAPTTKVTTPTVTSPTVTTPTTTTTTTPPQTTTPTTTTTPATTTPAATSAPTTTTTPITATTAQSLSTQASIAARATPTTGILGLSSTANQNEIAAAAIRIPSPAVTYTSRALDPKVAGTIFYIGIAGIFIGGCIMFAVRPRTRMAAV